MSLSPSSFLAVLSAESVSHYDISDFIFVNLLNRSISVSTSEVFNPSLAMDSEGNKRFVNVFRANLQNVFIIYMEDIYIYNRLEG